MIRITNPKGEVQVHTEESYEKLLWQFAESKMMDMWCRKHHLIPIYTHQEETILNKMVVEAFLEAFNYKSERQGLRFVEINESHTSKCSSLDLEEVKHHDSYVGKRVKRGLFRTRDGILLNADINGAYNIMRKVKGDAAMPPYRGFGYNPVKKFINK